MPYMLTDQTIVHESFFPRWTFDEKTFVRPVLLVVGYLSVCTNKWRWICSRGFFPPFIILPDLLSWCSAHQQFKEMTPPVLAGLLVCWPAVYSYDSSPAVWRLPTECRRRRWRSGSWCPWWPLDSRPCRCS